MESEISLIITSAATLISSMVLFFMKRFLNKHQSKEEDRYREKAKEYELIIHSLNALGKLTVANSIALRDGKCNGEMTAALEEYEQINKAMYEYLVSFHTEKMSK